MTSFWDNKPAGTLLYDQLIKYHTLNFEVNTRESAPPAHSKSLLAVLENLFCQCFQNTYIQYVLSFDMQVVRRRICKQNVNCVMRSYEGVYPKRIKVCICNFFFLAHSIKLCKTHFVQSFQLFLFWTCDWQGVIVYRFLDIGPCLSHS